MAIDDYDKTTYFSTEAAAVTAAHLTVFDGSSEPISYSLSGFGKEIITFGRGDQNDIVVRSRYISRFHGRFMFQNGNWVIEDNNSTNGLIFNDALFRSRRLEDGDSIRIDDMSEATVNGVLLVFTSAGDTEWNVFPVSGMSEITIGRGGECDIQLDHISVSRLHAKIIADGSAFYLIDAGSTNGVIVNGKKVESRIQLHEKDLILITNSKLIFSSQRISFCCYKSGISVEAMKIVKVVEKDKVICDGVDIDVKPGEMVAIIGGSGAGKTTVLNCLSGYSRPTTGSVVVNSVDLYSNFETMKYIIGYVPQSDIVFDNLTVYDMLRYAAQLRLPKDIDEDEFSHRIDDVIKTVELTERKDTLINSLSGGQRKRASIAVELLSDPNLFFLDEPASGLDPGTERNLMETLKKMADGGKTVVFVTHSTLNLHLCDRIVFMGAGGHLCFYGSLSDALKFFGVDDVVDIYNLITNEPIKWRKLYDVTQTPKRQITGYTDGIKKSSKKEWFKQTCVLSKRYLHTLINDRVRLLLIMLQAPLLALLISFVADGNQYYDYRITKSLLFALSCSAFWVGILNSIQEICKERSILKREYMTGMRLDSYIFSKIIVLAVVCAIQSFLLTSVFALAVGLPNRGVLMGAYSELMVTTFLTALSASATGLFVSSFFRKADRAMTMAPLLLMPQLLFSGLIFELRGASEIISFIAVCRWSVEGYGTTANLNLLDTITKDGILMTNDFEAFFEFTQSHQFSVWLILCGYIALYLIVAGVVLRNLNNERSK